MPDANILSVKSSDSALDLAARLADSLRRSESINIEALESKAIDNAIRAVAICRSYAERPGFALRVVPSFVTWQIHDEYRTAVRITVSLTVEAEHTPETNSTTESSEIGIALPQPRTELASPSRGQPRRLRRWTVVLIVLAVITVLIVTSPLWLTLPW